MRLSTGLLAILYAAVSAVYLLYLPHTLPVQDDWWYLQYFHQARTNFFHHLLGLIDNSWWQFRVFWTSLLPGFTLSFLAGFTAWPYFLMTWTAHLLTAVFLCRSVSLVSADERTGFLAGALYGVLPSANGAMFWFIGTGFYHFQSLFFIAWFYFACRKLLSSERPRYRWTDLALLFPALFSGEQVIPALLCLLPLTWVLLRRNRSALGFLACHTGAVLALLAFYILIINKEPVLRGVANRYSTQAWTLRPVSFFLTGAFGLQPEFSGWRPDWRLAPALLAVSAAALAGLYWGCRRTRPGRPWAGELLLWSVAGGLLTYLPIARIESFEWRYLYVGSLFLAPAAAAVLALAPPRAAIAAAGAAAVYCISLTYFEMSQCWIPQARIARGIVDAAPTVPANSILVISGEPLKRGPAMAFITANSWSVNNMLARHAPGSTGGRNLFWNERGVLVLHNRDLFRELRAEDIPRLRLLVRDPQDRFALSPLNLDGLRRITDHYRSVDLE